MSLAAKTVESVVPDTRSALSEKPQSRDNEGQRRDNEKTSMTLKNTCPDLQFVDKGTTRDNEIPQPDTSKTRTHAHAPTAPQANPLSLLSLHRPRRDR